MGLLNIGVTGLLASQTAINTTGHNIANANVQGYSRQEVVLETNAPRFGGGGFVFALRVLPIIIFFSDYSLFFLCGLLVSTYLSVTLDGQSVFNRDVF